MHKTNGKFMKSLVSGVAGATALTLVHEAAKRVTPQAPHMDNLAMQTIAQGFRAAGLPRPRRPALYRMALASDIVLNGLTYALVGLARKRPFLAGGLDGALMGVSAVLAPKLLGINPGKRRRGISTKAMTFGWYLLGGLAAAAVFKLLDQDETE